MPKFTIDRSVLTKEMKRALLLDEEVTAPGTALSAKSLSLTARPDTG